MFNILILCDFKGGTAQTIIDHCLSFEKYSKHRCFYMNPVGREFPSWLPLKFFDVIIIHYSIYTISEWYLDPTWITAIANSTCYRIMFIQDEYRRVNEFTNVMRRLRIHCLYTCVPAPEISKVYPTEKLPDVAKINTLTGYIPEQLNGKRPEFDKPRPLDVGYRGRSLGYWYGELGQEKRIIAEKFLHYSQGRGLICDISCREEDRIYGEAWIRFLKSCYCTLGTESGASVFDFTGEIEYNVKQYLKFHPDANFAEVREIYFKDQEYRIKLNQISPRAFEAIACGSCLVLFEGEYSEILEPDRHFIPLKKRFQQFR